jgi:hypothetical protein
MISREFHEFQKLIAPEGSGRHRNLPSSKISREFWQFQLIESEGPVTRQPLQLEV